MNDAAFPDPASWHTPMAEDGTVRCRGCGAQFGAARGADGGLLGSHFNDDCPHRHAAFAPAELRRQFLRQVRAFLDFGTEPPRHTIASVWIDRPNRRLKSMTPREYRDGGKPHESVWQAARHHIDYITGVIP